MAGMSGRDTITLLILLLIAISLPVPAESSTAPASKTSATECVILLHGFGRTPHSMEKMADRLEASGYTVWNEGYPSTEKPIDELVTDHLIPAVQWAKEMALKKFISSPIPWAESLFAFTFSKTPSPPEAES